MGFGLLYLGDMGLELGLAHRANIGPTEKRYITLEGIGSATGRFLLHQSVKVPDSTADKVFRFPVPSEYLSAAIAGPHHLDRALADNLVDRQIVRHRSNRL